jgi:hypothetical protein
VKLVKRGGLLVAVPIENVPPLITGMINRVIRQMRDRELRSAIRRIRKGQ